MRMNTSVESVVRNRHEKMQTAIAHCAGQRRAAPARPSRGPRTQQCLVCHVAVALHLGRIVTETLARMCARPRPNTRPRTATSRIRRARAPQVLASPVTAEEGLTVRSRLAARLPVRSRLRPRQARATTAVAEAPCI